VKGYVARALSRRGRSSSGAPSGALEPEGDSSEASAATDPGPATIDGMQQPKRLERQVDDDQVDNDTSRAREPENLKQAEPAADSKPGAEADAAGGEARAESTNDEGERRAAEAKETAGEDSGDAKGKPAASNQANSKVAKADGAKQTATKEPEEADEDEAEPATAAEPGAGEASDEAADTDGEPEDATEDDQQPATAEADTEADAEAETADAEAAEDSEPEASDDDETIDAEIVDEPEDGAEQPAAVVEEEPSEAVLAELVAARAEADGYLDDLRRLQAEFDNYRKRTMREQSARIASASQALVSRLLPVLDNFELAVSHAEQSRDFDRMLKGVEMVFGELNDLLAGEGLVAIEASGKPFDPERHEAVVAVEEDGVEAGTVVDVIRKGYEFNGRVLRPAMVKVAR
jgi:molecular chaperone GrpE